MCERRSIVVTGRVQNVGFRWFVVQRARSMGLVGWVRNAPDGTVEIEVQGVQDDLASFLAAMKEGPRFARVADVVVEEIPCGSGEHDFGVRF